VGLDGAPGSRLAALAAASSHHLPAIGPHDVAARGKGEGRPAVGD
jgi:hypothetical protein